MSYRDVWRSAGFSVSDPSDSVSSPGQERRGNAAPPRGKAAPARSKVPLEYIGKLVDHARNHSENQPDFFSSQCERFYLQSIARHIMPESGLSVCLRKRQPGRDVDIRRGEKRAYYGNLQTCHSVWGCPVCSLKISERRRVELDTAVKRACEIGWMPFLLTETVRHHAGQELVEVLDGALDARKRVSDSRAFKGLREKMSLKGSIRALEVTWGEANGWHVHFHELLFLGISRDFRGQEKFFEDMKLFEAVKRGLLERAPTPKTGQWNFPELVCLLVQDSMLPLWKRACVNAGLSEPDHHGIRVTGEGDVARYLGKWGAALEMTKGHIKKGHGPDRFTPWDFLRNWNGAKGVERTKWERLFRNYFNGFKGKKQLRWSEGLREKLGLDPDQGDAAIAAEVNPLDEILASIDRSDWNLILATNKRAELLEVAFYYGKEGIEEFIKSLRESLMLKKYY
jgi:hypothetical protein